MDKFNFKGKTAVITGGTSGIGLATAHELARRGCNVIITGRNEKALQDIPKELAKDYPKQRFEGYKLDLSDLPSIPKVIKKITDKNDKIGLLINNAGIAASGKFDELSLDDMEAVLKVNFLSYVIITKCLLPNLKKVPGSHIVNTSSIFGIIAPAGQAAYSSSKFAVRGFSDVLRHEMADYGIGVSTVFPGGVKTNIAKNARIASGAEAKKARDNASRFEANLTMTPEYAAATIVNGIEKRKARIIIGRSTKFVDMTARLLPAHHNFLLESIKK